MSRSSREWGKTSQWVSGTTACIWAAIHNFCHVTLNLICILHFHIAVEERTMWIQVSVFCPNIFTGILFACQSFLGGLLGIISLTSKVVYLS